MPRHVPENAETVLISPEDGEIIDLFIIRRSFNKDGSIRYIQLVGSEADITAFAHYQAIDHSKVSKNAQSALSLPRVIAARTLKRPLMSDEVVVQTNGKRGDCRRSNIEVVTKSDLAKGERNYTWSESGKKYVYRSASGKYFATVNDKYLGTFAKAETAHEAVEMFKGFVEQGVDMADAAKTVKKHFDRDPGIIISN